LEHTVKNTFGSPVYFKGKIVVDAGAGSGSQSKWMAESGCDYVIALELSHSVDGVMRKNMQGLKNVDVIQCSIDQVPLKDSCIPGLVICHNVIQHTRSVEDTARALWRTVAPGGEFAFNCYGRDDQDFIRRLRVKWYEFYRRGLSKRSFKFLLNYSRIVALMRFIPVLGVVMEKSYIVVRGDVPPGPDLLYRKYRAAVLNTFDCYGSHSFQHLKTPAEVRSLVSELQPDETKVANLEPYFHRPPPIGCALRLKR
jgi:SAM-dependent methyltransferase